MLRAITAVIIVFLCVCGLAPVVIAMLGHQRKMAQMFMDRDRSQSDLAARVACLEAELGRYQAAVSQESLLERLP